MTRPRINLSAPLLLQPNDRVVFSVSLKPIVGRLNQTGFDLEAHYMAQSVVARAVVKPDTAYQIVQESGIRSSLF